MAKRTEFWVLIRSSQEPSRVVIGFSDISPTELEKYGKSRGFDAAIGPFVHRFAAELMADYGANNPHMLFTHDCEEIASRLLAEADAAIEQKTSEVFEVATNNGQIFSNVKHTDWFREAVARHIFETN
jgi:hypothetical protein